MPSASPCRRRTRRDANSRVARTSGDSSSDFSSASSSLAIAQDVRRGDLPRALQLGRLKSPALPVVTRRAADQAFDAAAAAAAAHASGVLPERAKVNERRADRIDGHATSRTKEEDFASENISKALQRMELF